MAFGVFGALSGGVPGFVQGMEDVDRFRQRRTDRQLQQWDMMGMEALGRAFQGPQPPMPGQPSVPTAQAAGPPQLPPGGLGAGPPSGPGTFDQRFGQYSSDVSPAGRLPGWRPDTTAPGPSGAAAPPPVSPTPPSAAAGGGLPQGMFDLRTLTERIKAANPNLPPQAMLSALTRAMPLLNAEGRMQIAQMQQRYRDEMMDWRMRQLEQRREEAGQRYDLGRERLDVQREAETGRMSRADIAADLRRQAEEGRERRSARSEEGRTARAELSSDTRLALGRLSAETKREIADQLEGGRMSRAQMSDRAKREIAKLNIDSRRELTQMLEEGREQRSVRAEEGRMARAELSDNTKRELAKLSKNARIEIEAMRGQERMDVALLSMATREQVAKMNIDARKELFGAAEAGRQQRFDTQQERLRDQFATNQQRLRENADRRFSDAAARLEEMTKRRLSIEERSRAAQDIKLTEDELRASHNAQIEQIQSNFLLDAKEKKRLTNEAIANRDRNMKRLDELRSRIREGGGKGAPAAPAEPAPSTAPTTQQPGDYTNPQTGQVIFFDQARNAWVDRKTGQPIAAQ